MDSESAHKIQAYKVVGYAAVTFSAVAVLSIAITLPMVYNYVHEMRRTTMHELHSCKVTFSSSILRFSFRLRHSLTVTQSTNHLQYLSFAEPRQGSLERRVRHEGHPRPQPYRPSGLLRGLSVQRMLPARPRWTPGISRTPRNPWTPRSSRTARKPRPSSQQALRARHSSSLPALPRWTPRTSGTPWSPRKRRTPRRTWTAWI